MSVWLNAAGEVLDMKITNSSGTSVLDEAAKRILRIAQPFRPLSRRITRACRSDRHHSHLGFQKQSI